MIKYYIHGLCNTQLCTYVQRTGKVHTCTHTRTHTHTIIEWIDVNMIFSVYMTAHIHSSLVLVMVHAAN